MVLPDKVIDCTGRSCFSQGRRVSNFLGDPVVKYHKTWTTYVHGLIRPGFGITGLVEPEPGEKLLRTVAGMNDELRRPMMLIVSAVKER